jgi:putative ABC transport system permease protein
MGFLKRALLAVTRQKGKSVIIFVIFIAIANMVIAGLAIQHATEYASVSARQKLGGQLTLSYDTQGAMQKARAAGEQRPNIQSEPVTEDMAKTIASDTNILNYNYIVNSNGLAEGFTAVVTDTNQQNSSTNSNGNSSRAGGGFAAGGNYTMPDVSVTGVLSTELLDGFKNGQDTLVDGRQITAADADKKVAMIEKNLADQNSLKVGDTIEVKGSRSDTSVKYTIAGIYQAASSSSSSDGGGMRDFSFSQPYNKIYVDYKSAIPLKTVTADTGTTTGGIDQIVFNVDDPQNIDKVMADVKTMNIDWSKFILDANDAAYKQMMEPINNVASFAMTAVYIVAIAGAIILALILMLSVKERMYETGVLLSMGEGKIKVIAQYVTEALLIAVLAFGISMFSGMIIAQDVGNALLNREVNTAQQVQSAGNTGRTGGMNIARGQLGTFGRLFTNVQAIDSMNIQVTPKEAGQMSAAGLIILLAGTVLPAATIMRYKPKAILTKTT